jgi:hypothetical protein
MVLAKQLKCNIKAQDRAREGINRANKAEHASLASHVKERVQE